MIDSKKKNNKKLNLLNVFIFCYIFLCSQFSWCNFMLLFLFLLFGYTILRYHLKKIFFIHLTHSHVFLFTAGGTVSIATTDRKRSGTKIDISPLRYMIETSVFFHYTHIYSRNLWKF
jgi:hypothetical protein